MSWITPACAGKSFRLLLRECDVWDHPRLCGEKTHLLCETCSLNGSPPPVRGKAKFGDDEAMRIRITPACAGKSECEALVDVRTGDHPRLCGEKYGAEAQRY